MTDLATAADLEARLGRTLTAAETAKAPALLADASALIRRYTRQTFTAVTGDVIVLRPIGTRIRLPQRPVTAVTSVVVVGWAGLADITLPVGAWAFDGIDIVDVDPNLGAWMVNVPDVDAEWTGSADTYRITYNHGAATVPDDVIAVCCAMVLRVLLSPTAVENMTSERIGNYSYQMGQFVGGGSPGPVVRLTEADKDALKDFRRKAGTIEVRL